MNIPFTKEQFMSVFAQYNTSVWPMQIGLKLLALLVIVLSVKKIKNSDLINGSVLAFFWLWIGLIYHLAFFSAINKAAYIFGILFIVQALLFVTASAKKQIAFQFNNDTYSLTGALFIIYAMLIYPILGYNLGHVYPEAPTFDYPA